MIRAKIAKALSSIVVMVGLSLPSVVQAETPAIGWTAAHLTSDPSCIRNDGTTVYAYAAGNYKVNGVQFAQVTGDVFPNNANVTWNGGMSWGNKSKTIEGVADEGYAGLLSKHWQRQCYQNGAAGAKGSMIITLNNLTSGKKYLVQIIGCGNWYDTSVYVDESGEDVSGAVYNGGDGWTYGGSLIGVFTATDTSKEIVLMYTNPNADWTSWNAIQVRELSGGDDPDPTVVEPTIGSLVATVNGMAATFDVSGITLGTDDQGVAAGSYKLEYIVKNSNGTTIKGGTCFTNRTDPTASFNVADFSSAGTYTCVVTVTTDKEKTVSESVEFTLAQTNFAVSWTGGANATVAAEANGSAITSGSLVGNGTNVVFTVTPDTDYEFAEASYQDWTKSGEALTRTVTVNGAAVNITIPDATEKTTPPGPDVDYGWTGAKLPSDTSLVKTDGTLIYAYAKGDYLVNTVSFTGLTNSDFDWSQGNQPLVNDDFSIGIVASWTTSHSAPEGTSGEYANMLKNGWWLNGGTYPLVLKNLTSGKDYLVQVFCYRSSYNDGHVTIDGETLQGESYITSGGEGWSNGGTIIGIFHADSDTETFTIKSTSQWCFNAIQMRELSSVGPTPATYAVSWTGGANATVVAEANGSAISSGALVGDGTNVVFTVTPNSGYEFASASDDWTLSSGKLTKTFTVNGAALSVTVPNATKQADPPQELGWTAAKMTADPASIRKDGVLCYAYACGGDYIVNDVEFIKILNSDREEGNQDKPIDNANLRWEVTNATQGQDAPGTTGDYTGLLKHCWWWWSDAALTLRNLTPGHTYLVQVIGCRAGHQDTTLTSIAVVEAGDNSIFMKAAGDGWECGGTLVGSFEASDTTQTFHFNKFTGSWSAFNAIQVRDLSLTDDDAVAIIERGATTNYFFSIGDAYTAALVDETIKLVKDADFPMNDPVFSKGVDLDLNGHSITRSNVNRVKEITSETVISNGTLAFATEAYSADLATPFFVDGAALTLDALKVGDSAGNEPICLMTLTNSASVVLSGDGVYHAGSLFKSYDDGDTMTITGGRYVLRGWSFPGNETGDFTKFDNGTLTISGGSFSIAPDKSWIASGYVILHDVTDRETPYHVVPADAGLYTEEGWTYYYADAAAAESAHVAKRETAGGVKYYTSVQDAVEAADGVGTVTLVADVPAIDREVVLTGTVTLDGNGHSVSVAHPYVDESGYVSKNYSFNVLHVVSVSKDADAVLRDISITGGGTVNGEQPFVTLAEKGLSAVANAGTLLMDNVTVTRSNGAIVNLNEGKLFMDNCRIVRNCRFCAGGLFNMYGGFAVMNRTSLSENRSLGQGGGGGAAENGGTLFVNNCVVVNNSSTEIGGAINNYGPGKDPKLYLMNTTIAGNFSSIFDSGNQYEGKKGGGLGLQSGEKGGEVIAVNSIITCNYQTRTDNLALGWDIKESDILSVEGDMDISLYYTVFTAMDVNPTGGVAAVTSNVRQLGVDNENVFNTYYASGRIYQNANPTAMEIKGAQLISKDDGSLDASLARYAPVLRTDNGDGTYTYGDAVYGTAGVYTYFDPSNWKNSEVKMAYAMVNGTPDFFNYESAGTLQQVGNIPLADATSMVTNYYESAWGRSFGVAGASGWLMDEKIRYTVKLAGEPENGTVSGVTLFGDTYEDGTVITLTATPGYARDFLGWYEITDGGATTNFLTGSDKTVWELTVDHDYLLLAKFSDLKEILTPEPFVHTRMADDGEDGPKLYPISVTTDWMTRHYTDFVSNLDKKVSEDGIDAAKAWLTTLLEQVDEDTGLKMWQDYVLGIEPGDKNAKIWINSPQYMSTSKNLIRMEMNRLSPVSGTKYTVNYRLDKKLGEATTFARADVNGTGSYDVKVDNDPSGLYVIDVLFIPEGKATSEEYVTTVNTAGVLRVSNGAKRAAVSVPWTKLQPTGSDPVRAVNLVKTTNLTPDDVLYVYDLAKKDYRAWKMDANGNWSPLNVFKIGTDGFVDWDDPDAIEAAGEGSEVARGLGIWLERANTNDFIYLCGQYESAPVASTALSEGWNLVGNPATEPFDIKTVTPSDGDQIIVPTAAEPKNYTYEDGVWGYWKKEIIERSGGRKSVQTVRKTEDTTVPAGCGFWYISDGGGTLDWTGAKEEK